MTTRTLAERIVRDYAGYGWAAALSPEALQGIVEIEFFLEEMLREAENQYCDSARWFREGMIEGRREVFVESKKDIELNGQFGYEAGIEKGRAVEREECAKIAERYWDHIPQEVFDEGFEIPKKDYPDFVHTDIANQIRRREDL